MQLNTEANLRPSSWTPPSYTPKGLSYNTKVETVLSAHPQYNTETICKPVLYFRFSLHSEGPCMRSTSYSSTSKGLKKCGGEAEEGHEKASATAVTPGQGSAECGHPPGWSAGPQAAGFWSTDKPAQPAALRRFQLRTAALLTGSRVCAPLEDQSNGSV